MRINSPKQTEASRVNGSNSKGPASTDGKSRVRLNALKGGFLCKDIVVESAGERLEDFEKLKKQMCDFFQPASPLEEMLVADIIENHWRRRRVRQCEAVELTNRIKAQEIRDRLEREDKVRSLR